MTPTAHHSEDVTYKQVRGYIQCITLNHDPGLNPVDVEVSGTGYWDDNLPDTDPDTGYPLKPGYGVIKAVRKGSKVNEGNIGKN